MNSQDLFHREVADCQRTHLIEATDMCVIPVSGFANEDIGEPFVVEE